MDCPEFNVLDLQEFSLRISKPGIPLGGGLEITQRCNLNCVHCYCRRPADDRGAREQEPSLETICSIVDQMAEEGVLYLFLTGGEILIRRDFPQIYRHIRSRGILVMLLTNGTLITPQMADFFAEQPPLAIELTAYGATEETYERITRVPGSYRRYRQGLERLLDRGIEVFLKTPAMTLNQHEIGQLAEFSEGLGCEYRFDVNLHPRLEGMDDPFGPYAYGLPLKERLELDLTDKKRVDAFLAYAERVNDNGQRPNTIYKCGAGVNGFFVDVRGHMTMCVASRYPSYDLNVGTFASGWEFLKELRLRVEGKDDLPECKECQLQVFCRQCPARSQLEYGPGVLTRRVDWLCEWAHLRADAFARMSN
jgi:radical SAM protein with 4Fe4S-binding SPASM domain